MALGFGFNKTKVLSAAEKFVQQGKLQNAIVEYEKVVKEDPKDLTVLNTIGDLYARVGSNEKACEYFKKVGDQYAQNGFTVKAIAIYKKLTKLPPVSPDAIIKLAELYTQQGLFNDARSHYMQVADQLLKSGDNNQAARLFQKILELDPENTATQSKLADLYIKLGKKDEARNIYYSAAESLYARSSLDAADEALSRVLSLDPSNKGALLLRGMIASASGDNVSAIQYLEQVPDLDSRPDALRALLRAKLASGSVEGLEAIASKLITVHNDATGITALAEWFLTNHHVEAALKLYDDYADRFLSRGPNALHDTLYPLISRIRDNAQALTTMLRLLNKAGDSSHLTEVMELLAHAYVQQGEFSQARDLYRELSEQEPENPLHTQNYRQMLAKLGQDSAMRSLTPEEGSQAFMVEELEHAAPAVHQTYDPAVERSIEAALTDAELFVSYNVPQKAIAPLENALPLAPRDVNLNQRLATLYVRAERYADAVRVCQLLSAVYREAGHGNEGARYAEAAQRYEQQAARMATPSSAPVAAPVQELRVPPAYVEPIEPEPAATSTVQEFILDTPIEDTVTEDTVTDATVELKIPFSAAVPGLETPAGEATVSGFGFEGEEATETPSISPAMAHEIDLSSEWEDMLTVESEVIPPPAAAAPLQELTVAEEPAMASPEPVIPQQIIPAQVVPEPVVSESSVSEPISPEPVAALPDIAAVVADKVQEIQFYISQGFWDIAQGAIEDLRQIAPETAQLAELEATVAAGQNPVPEPAPPEPVMAAPAAIPEPVAPPAVAQPAAVVEPMPIVAPMPVAQPAPTVQAIPAVQSAPVAAPTPPSAPPARVAPPVEEEEFILDVPDELGPAVEPEPKILEIPEISAKPEPATPPAPAPVPVAAAPAIPEKPTEDILGDFVLDLEESLGDFLPDPPQVHLEEVQIEQVQIEQVQPQQVSAEPAHQVQLEKDDPLELLELEPEVLPPPATMPPPVEVTPPSVAAARSAPPSPMIAAAHPNGQMQDVDAASVLSDILTELREEAEDSSQETEDPETHYNLGIAFKEMGLLDEAIGELQKVCHAVDNGSGFSQPIQAFTWLAQCLVDKGVPEAAVRWYERALKIPGLDLSSRCSIYYDLGAAYESFGDKKTALANYMEVYSSNIDFRDVANRIKALKS